MELPYKDVEVKTDCFAYRTDVKKCNCLVGLFCKREVCTFYKPRTQIDININKYK